MDTTGYFYLTNGISLGTSAVTRVGRVIRIQSFLINITLVATAASGNTNTRMMVIIDHQANGNAPALANDVLEGAVQPMVVQPRGLNQRKRYTILLDRVYRSGAIMVGADPATRYIRLFKRFRPSLETNYNGGITGQIADIVTNSLYLVMVSDNTTGPAANIYTRIRFTDN